MKNLLSLFLTTLLSVGFYALGMGLPSAAQAQVQNQSRNQAPKVFKGFVRVRAGVELYTEYFLPQNGQPTLVLLNGLTYSTTQWDRYTEALLKKGYGILRYDMQGMGKTLLKYAPAAKLISYEDQVKDLKALLIQMKVRAPYNLVGLSYGGGIGIRYATIFPQEIKNLVLLAPFTEPIAQTDQWIKYQVWLTRKANPMNPATDDELYDFYLHQSIYMTFPTAEPVVLENPFKLEGIYRLVQGIRKFQAVDVAAKLPRGVVHLILAEKDQYVPGAVLMNFWKKVPAAAKRSISQIMGSEHKMPEAVPQFMASFTAEIIDGNKLFFGGRSFVATPKNGVVRYSGGQFKLPKE
jgi:pimeloyl-ACP methyl ester carboxylesterase